MPELFNPDDMKIWKPEDLNGKILRIAVVEDSGYIMISGVDEYQNMYVLATYRRMDVH